MEEGKRKQIHHYKKKPNGKNDTGRPDKYKPEYCLQIVERFKSSQEKIYYETTYYKPSEQEVDYFYENNNNTDKELQGGKKSVSPKLIRQLFPTFQRRATINGTTYTTMRTERAKKYKEFFEALDKCKEIQEAILLECGLSGTFNSNITQLILKNNHGYRDKSEIEHSGEVEQKIVYLPQKEGTK